MFCLKRQLLYSIKKLCFCQELFLFFFAVRSSDSLFILPHRFLFVNNFFQVLLTFLRISLLSDSRLLSNPLRPPVLFSSAKSLPFSATLTILSSLSLIVNVFSLFYLFRTIQTILSFQSPLLPLFPHIFSPLFNVPFHSYSFLAI